MSEDGTRTGAPRDVPPPRPVAPTRRPSPVDETGLGRAARALAEAVAGLVGERERRTAGRPGGCRGSPPSAASAATGLRDVLGAVTGAVGAAFGPAREPDAGPGRPRRTAPGGDRSPGTCSAPAGAAAPRLPIRDAARLRRAYPGASDEEIADQLVARAARLTGGIGAATGGLSAAHWFAPASLLRCPSSWVPRPC